MKTKVRLLLVFGASLLAAAPASAWHHHRYSMAPMPMMPMQMPMMNMGMMPMMNMGVMPMPMMTPALVGANGMSMSFSMSGDMTMALLLPSLLRNLAGTFLGVPGAAGMTEAQVAALARQVVSNLVASGNVPMTQNQGRQLIDLLTRILNDRGALMPAQPAPKPAPGNGAASSSPELERARAEIRRLVAEGAARNNGRANIEQARAEIRRLVAEGAARQNRPAVSDLERARAEVRRLVAEGAARQNARNRPPVTTLASGAK
jgi:hypothetical protein